MKAWLTMIRAFGPSNNPGIVRDSKSVSAVVPVTEASAPVEKEAGMKLGNEIRLGISSIKPCEEYSPHERDSFSRVGECGFERDRVLDRHVNRSS